MRQPMQSEWQETTLGEFVTLQRGHDLPDGSRNAGNIPILGSFGITGWHNSAKAKGPGVTVGRSGASFGVVSYSPVDYWPLNTALYVKDFHGNDPKFAYYFLKSIDFKSYNTGSAQPSLNRNHIHPIQIRIPEPPEQKAIAHILGSLDDKIELNRQMNATLEAMAQALFKSWFVDFDPVLDNALAAGNPIPDELQDKAAAREALGDARKPLPEDIAALFPAAFVWTEEMGWIPEGWEIRKVGEIITRLQVGQKYSQKTALETGNVPILDQGKSGIIGFHNDTPGVSASAEDPVIVFANHTCYMRLIMHDFSAIQNVLPFRSKTMNIHWLYHATYGKQEFLEYKGHWPDFILHNIVVPEEELTNIYGGLVSKEAIHIFKNEKQNDVLSVIRDTLLPKLLSGELRIPDAEKLVEDALV
jgi:type I restriction enzyme S subunit